MTNLDSWFCEAGGQKTDLTTERFKSALVRDLNAALAIDLQEGKGRDGDAVGLAVRPLPN